MAYIALNDAKTFYEEKHDRGTFVKNIIMDNILPGDIYIRAKELHFATDAPRAVFLIRQVGHSDVATVDVLAGMFPDKMQDFVLSINESDVAVIKQITGGTTPEDLEKIAKSMEDTLKNELRNLMELNRRITAETTNLTNALRGNSKVQGDWGEMILETILDGSNLIKGVHYHTQVNLRDETGSNLRPDVVLHLPENKRIVIDSKVSLTAYVNYVGSQDEEERRRQLAAHVQSVRQHVAELGRKEYQRLLESPDFVIMFVPNEPAFLAAMQSDSAIWSDAYERKVIVSSPTNLFALLKLVDDLWKRNAQSKNTADIVTYGTKLYEQLVAFTASLEGVGQSLDQARERYGDAYKRLTSGNDNIVRCGERLRKLGLPTKRRQSPRVLEAASAYDEADDASTPADAVPPADTVSQ